MPEFGRTGIEPEHIRAGCRNRSPLFGEASTSTARRSLALWIWSALLMADIVLVSRRVAGELNDSLPGLLSVITTVFMAAGSWAAWVMWKSTPSAPDRVRQRSGLTPLWISLLLTLVWTSTIALHAPPFALGLLIGVLALYVGASLAWEGVGFGSEGELIVSGKQIHPATIPQSDFERPLSTMTNEPGPAILLAPPCNEEVERGEFESSVEAEENVTLWLSRRSEGAEELIEGWTRVDFARGQREAIVHVAFCPPLANLPVIETEDLDGVGLEIRVATAFPFGARLSVRRTDGLEEGQSHRVGFVAMAASASRAA